MAEGDRRLVDQALRALAAGGVDAIEIASYPRQVLETGAHQVEIVVRWRHLRRTLRVLDGQDWTYRVGWTLRQLAYWWPEGVQLFVSATLPGAGQLGGRGRRLRAMLRSCAVSRPGIGPEASPPWRVVYLAARASAGPGSFPESPRKAFEALEPTVAPALADRVARHARLSRVLNAAREGARSGAWPSRVPHDGRVVPLAADIATRVRRRWASPRLRRWIVGLPVLGASPTRARVEGIEVRVPPNAFVPTPDAVRLARMALDSPILEPGSCLAEVGCATGAVSLCVASRRPDVTVVGAELDPSALRAAKSNARRLGLHNVELREGSLLDPLRHDFDGRVAVLVANLPFYPEGKAVRIGDVDQATIEGLGDDGLGLYRQLLADVPRVTSARADLVLQMFSWQWPLLAPDLRRAEFEPVESVESGVFVLGRARRLG